MSSTHTDWPAQVVLAGQAAAPEGPVDLSNMYLFHHAFRRDLAAFCAAVPTTPLDDRAAWGRLARRWGLFADQLHHHHQAEDDVLWPWLTERVDAAGRDLLSAMEAEHEAIDPALAQVGQAFATLAARADDDLRAALVVRLAGLQEAIGRHLAHEERDAMAVVQQVTTQGEWHAVEKKLGAGQPARGLLVMVPWALYGVDPAVLRRLVAAAPLPMRLLARLLGPRFARREEAVFGGR